MTFDQVKFGLKNTLTSIFSLPITKKKKIALVIRIKVPEESTQYFISPLILCDTALGQFFYEHTIVFTVYLPTKKSNFVFSRLTERVNNQTLKNSSQLLLMSVSDCITLNPEAIIYYTSSMTCYYHP